MTLFNFKSKKNKPVLKKNMNWTQAKAKYPTLSPSGDADKDGVKNWLDCKPFDRKRQEDWVEVEKEFKESYPEEKFTKVKAQRLMEGDDTWIN